MSYPFAIMPGPGNMGLFPAQWEPLAKNVTAAAFTVGTVCMFDMQLSDGDTTTVDFGATTSWTACIVAPDAAGLRRNILCVVTEPAGIAAAGTGRVCVLGVVTAKVDGSGTNATKGVGLIGTTGGKLVIEPATGAAQRIIGYLKSTSTVSTDTTASVWFNGLGWAQHRDN